MSKQFLLGFVSAIIMILAVSCSSLLNKNNGVLGKAGRAEDIAAERISNVDKNVAKVSEDRLTHIGAYAEGTDYSLKKITNAPPEVVTAEKMNDRVKALANKPDFKEVEAIKGIVDELCSQNDAIRKDGQKALEKKDKEIASLQKNIADLKVEKDDAIKGYMELADQNAAKADQYQATIKELDSGWGLSAVWYGLKKLFTHIFWTVTILGVLFVILRFAAASNPIAASIFSIFEQVFAWAINCIKRIAPKATAVAGLVENNVFIGYKTTLMHIIDAIQMIKTKETAGTQHTIDDLMNEIAVSMDAADKDRVDEIKKSLNWR